MLFQTTEFAVFFLVVSAVHFALSLERRTWLLLAASYYFYMSWDARFAVLILASTIIDYVCCIGIEQNEARRRPYLVASIACNLGILGFFKYYGFFVDSATDAMSVLGFDAHLPALDIVLPVGISFFTFQSMSHTTDVYRREIRAERSFLRFALFVAFFPQLVAGPIVRASQFLPQLRRRFRFNAARLYWGLERILVGLAKKVVIADNLSPLVDLVYADPSIFDTKMLWLATLCYSVQIYADFSGYSDMAIGLARILGFKIPENFDMPYCSRTPSEFWRRWHISLSTWLRDYLYIPLGGNRGGRVKTERNLMLTMLLGGLWHGASYNFILWGGIHGLLLVIYRPIERVAARLKGLHGPVLKLLSTALLFLIVTTAWVPFRARSLADCGTILEGMYVGWSFGFEVDQLTDVSLTFVAVILAVVLVAHVVGTRMRPVLAFARRTPVLRSVTLAVLVFTVFQFRFLGQTPFVYFQF